MTDAEFTVELETPGKGAVARLEWIGGPRPYLWVGDDEGGCYGTATPKQLERLAHAILEDKR